ncbi:MAG: NAD(P)H-dependent oxidoreductase [Desulfobacterales bacterium]|nr:NAD(P)H-dependent oxidoreductase [Desulfobacterales bacterium]
MFILGLQGSPRKKGNTDILLSTFMGEAEKLGARTQTIDVTRKNIEPCKELVVCEKKGYCPIEDEMESEVYPLIRQADIIVIASPVFFYSVSAQLKAAIDRCQMFWARKYCLKLSDPLRNTRRGFMLAVGATKGKLLFSGIELLTKIFYDAVGAKYEGSLTYRGVEKRGEIADHPTMKEDVKNAVAKLLQPLMKRKKVLFACRENACRSQIAAAFAQQLAGDRIEALCGGSTPIEKINPMMSEVMAESGIDMEYRVPQSIEDALVDGNPEIIVTMGCGEACPILPGTQRIDWDLEDPAAQSIEFMRKTRDEIEQKVIDLIKDL